MPKNYLRTSYHKEPQITMTKINIQAGLNKKEDFEYFTQRGVDELYCGINTVPSHLYYVKTFNSPDEVINTAKLARKKKIKFFFAANEIQSYNFYETYEIIEYLVRNKIDGIIIRDIGLLKYLKEKKIKTYFILSSLSLCFNQQALKFYYDLGIKRIAIPEQITFEEAKYLIKNPFKIETEMFLTSREYCGVLNGFCYLKQFNNRCLCREEFETGDKKFKMPIPSLTQHYANLYRFIKCGVHIIKIGRHPDDFYGKIIFTQAQGIKDIIENNPGITEEEFIKKAIKLHTKISGVLEKCKKIYLKH